MSARKASDVLLQVGNGESPETFSTVGGLRNTNFSFAKRPIVITHDGSQHWQQMLENGGTRSVSVSGNGIFESSAAETRIRDLAFGNALANYRILFGDGNALQGRFTVVRFDSEAAHGGEQSYALSLESSGPVAYGSAGA